MTDSQKWQRWQKQQKHEWIYATGIYCDPKEWEALINPEPPRQAEIDLNNKMIKRLRKQNAEYKFKLEQHEKQKQVSKA